MQEREVWETKTILLWHGESSGGEPSVQEVVCVSSHRIRVVWEAIDVIEQLG